MGRLWGERFLKEGAKIILWDIDKNALEDAGKELDRKYTGLVSVAVVDITDSRAC